MGTTGRPSIISDERRETICQMIRAGNYRTVAAAHAGITAETIREWEAKGKRDVENGLTETQYARFAVALARAEAQAEGVRVVRLQMAGERDWRADAWFLERRFPERWAARSTVTLAGELGLTVDSSLVVDPAALELGEALLDGLIASREAKLLTVDALTGEVPGEGGDRVSRHSRPKLLPDAPAHPKTGVWQLDGPSGDVTGE